MSVSRELELKVVIILFFVKFVRVLSWMKHWNEVTGGKERERGINRSDRNGLSRNWMAKGESNRCSIGKIFFSPISNYGNNIFVFRSSCYKFPFSPTLFLCWNLWDDNCEQYQRFWVRQRRSERMEDSVWRNVITVCRWMLNVAECWHRVKCVYELKNFYRWRLSFFLFFCVCYRTTRAAMWKMLQQQTTAVADCAHEVENIFFFSFSSWKRKKGHYQFYRLSFVFHLCSLVASHRFF